MSHDYTNSSPNSHGNIKILAQQNSSFLPHSSLKESQSKLTKSRRDLFSSCTYKNALGESPRTNTFPPPSFLPPHNFFHFFPFFRKEGMGGGKWGWREGNWGERRKRAAIKAIFAAYVSPSLSLASFIHLSGGGWGRIAKRLGDMLFSRAG